MNKRKFLPVAIALVAVIAVSGVAYAYWTSSGSGTGNGSTANGETDILTATSGALNPMYPGDTAQDVVITVHNNSTTQTVHVTQVVVAVKDTTNSGCTAADFTVTGATVTVGADVPHGGDLALVGPTYTEPTIQFHNTSSNQNACQNVTVHLAFTIS